MKNEIEGWKQIAQENLFPDERRLAQYMAKKLRSKMKKSEMKLEFIEVLKRIRDIKNIDDVLIGLSDRIYWYI